MLFRSVSDAALDIAVKFIGIKKLPVAVIVQGDRDDMIVFDAALEEMIAEELEEQIRLAAPPDPRDDLHEPVLFMLYEFVEIVVAFDFHIALREIVHNYYSIRELKCQ